MNKNNIWYIALAILILIGLFYFLKPKPTVVAPSSTPNSQAKTFNLTVKDKKLEGDNTLKATEGDQITINITSDEDEEFHLHGYDKSVDLEATRSAQLEFPANLTGRFEIELEKSKTEIGALEVQPK